jgi:cob(I)alamin adenosyltransferase
VDLQEVVETLSSRPKDVNVIVTGRDAPDEIVEIADTVTEMRKIKHAYDSGIMARRGIDY